MKFQRRRRRTRPGLASVLLSQNGFTVLGISMLAVLISAVRDGAGPRPELAPLVNTSAVQPGPSPIAAPQAPAVASQNQTCCDGEDDGRVKVLSESTPVAK